MADGHPRHVGAQLHHLAGGFQSQDFAGAGRRRVMPFALHQVGAVDGGGAHPDEHLVSRGRGVGDLGELEHFGAAGAAGDDRSQGSSISRFVTIWRFSNVFSSMRFTTSLSPIAPSGPYGGMYVMRSVSRLRSGPSDSKRCSWRQ